MSKTNLGLVEFALSKVGCGYIYGATGQIGSEALIHQFAAMFPNIYNLSYISMTHRWIGVESYDCAGVIDAYCGINTTANNYYFRATIKGSSMGNFPGIPGTLVHMDGHVGVYIGNGQVVEARGVNYGVVITTLAARPWARWSQCYLIQYITETPPEVKIEFTLTRELKRGMSGDDVRPVQKVIGVISDGSFGPNTETAVKVWQGKHNLTADGVVGPATCRAMGGTWTPPIPVIVIPTRPVNPYAIPQITLYAGKTGMTRTDVKWLQFELNWRYGSEITIDGSFGPVTTKYIVVFQKAAGLDQDGNCGPITRDKLKTIIK